MRKVISLVSIVAIVATAAYAAGAASSHGGARAGTDTALPGFSQVVFLSHVNDPAVIPGFPGDPKFSLKTAFTVAKDGFYMQYVKEGEHTGTHYSAPCHFHVDELCADQMDPGDFILPAVVVDIREQTAADVDYRATVADLEAWVADNGPMPHDAAVLLWTGCDAFLGPDRGPGRSALLVRQRQGRVPPARLLARIGEVADRTGRARRPAACSAPTRSAPTPAPTSSTARPR